MGVWRGHTVHRGWTGLDILEILEDTLGMGVGVGFGEDTLGMGAGVRFGEDTLGMGAGVRFGEDTLGMGVELGLERTHQVWGLS